MGRTVPLVIGIGILLGWSTLAWSGEERSVRPGKEGKSQCAAERERLCGGIGRGGGRVARCLEQHREALAAACRAPRTGEREPGNKGSPDQWKACTNDRERLCSGVEPGGGRVAKCLEQHLEELSGECLQAIQAHPLPRPPGGEGSGGTKATREADDWNTLLGDYERGIHDRP